MGTPKGATAYGVAGTLDHTIIRTLARRAEDLGFSSFWVNDLPGGEGLAGLAAAAEVTSRIRLAVGVIPLDRQSPQHITMRIEELALPIDRVLVGVGSGDARGGLDRVRQGVADLRSMTAARIAVGALGPKMCALSGECADAVLLNWLVPAYIPESLERVNEGARAAGRLEPERIGYVRVAEAAGKVPLEAEAARYASYPAYAANFARMGVQAIDTTILGSGGESIRDGLRLYQAELDEIVARCIAATESVDAYLRVMEAAAPYR